MPKRFTETSKWDDPWYRKLSPEFKLGWQYLTDRCDVAGVIELDRELANFRIGAEIDWDGLLVASDGRIEKLPKDKLWIASFCAFQYGELSEACNAHKPVFASLRKHSLLTRVLNGYQNPTSRVQEQEQDKDKDKDKEGESEGKKPRKRFEPPTAAEVQAYCDQRSNGISGQKFVDYYKARGWKVKGGGAMVDWKAAVHTWEGNEFNRGSPPPSQSVRDRQRADAIARFDNGNSV